MVKFWLIAIWLRCLYLITAKIGGLVEAFTDTSPWRKSSPFETLGEVADQLFGFVGIVLLPCLSQHTPDRSMQRIIGNGSIMLRALWT